MKALNWRYYAIGSIFSIGRGLYIVRRSDAVFDRCVGCALRYKKCCVYMNCAKELREDEEDVIFERI